MTTKRIIIAVERLLNLHSKFDKINKNTENQKEEKKNMSFCFYCKIEDKK